MRIMNVFLNLVETFDFLIIRFTVNEINIICAFQG